MKLSTCKGDFVGSVRECSAWLQNMQPSMVAVVVGSAEVALDESPDSLALDETGAWFHGKALQALLREAEMDARAEALAASAA
jgi:hypothetical protein